MSIGISSDQKTQDLYHDLVLKYATRRKAIKIFINFFFSVDQIIIFFLGKETMQLHVCSAK